MKHFISLLALAVLTAFLLSFALTSAAQETPATGTVVAPPSTLGIPGLPRTPLYVFIPEGGLQPSIPLGETPASIACIYGVTKKTPGCPKNGTVLPSGGSKAIAVIEYGSNSTMKTDVSTFSTAFGLPAPNVTEICAVSSCPSNNGTGWDLETATDVQWAHAIAPNAQIYVVEFANDPLGDGAEQKAANLVVKAGGGEVSNSWGYRGGEPPQEKQYDKYFQTKGIVYFASAGDGGAIPQYPSVSPYVVSAGGTHITRDTSGNFTSESCWSGSGGGLSVQEPRPAYQNVIKKLVGSHRGTPDLAAEADPNTGVAVFSSTYCHGWCQVGGTSVSSPLLAAITNVAGGFAATTNVELTKIYKEYANPTEYKQLFRDITIGNNGKQAKKGWDECTGVGAPKNLKGE